MTLKAMTKKVGQSVFRESVEGVNRQHESKKPIPSEPETPTQKCQ